MHIDTKLTIERMTRILYEADVVENMLPPLEWSTLKRERQEHYQNLARGVLARLPRGLEPSPSATALTEDLAAMPKRYTLKTLSTLGECLRRTRKVRPTPILYLYLGQQGWRESEQAYDLIVKGRSIEVYGDAYRGFDVEQESAYPPQRGAIHIVREED